LIWDCADDPDEEVEAVDDGGDVVEVVDDEEAAPAGPGPKVSVPTAQSTARETTRPALRAVDTLWRPRSVGAPVGGADRPCRTANTPVTLAVPTTRGTGAFPCPDV
jgi:hypothetical protein